MILSLENKIDTIKEGLQILAYRTATDMGVWKAFIQLFTPLTWNNNDNGDFLSQSLIPFNQSESRSLFGVLIGIIYKFVSYCLNIAIVQNEYWYKRNIQLKHLKVQCFNTLSYFSEHFPFCFFEKKNQLNIDKKTMYFAL